MFSLRAADYKVMTMKYLIVLIVQLTVIFYLVLKSESARILAVFPIPSISHQVVFRPITQELARRGHEVVVVTPDPAFPEGQPPSNLTEIDVHDLSYRIFTETFQATSTGKSDDITQKLKVAMDLVRIIIGKQIQEQAVANIIENEKDTFDLLLIEAMARPALVYSHFIKVPTILVSSCGGFMENFETIGAPQHLTLYPALIRQKLNNLTFWDKMVEIHQLYKIQASYMDLEEEENKMIRNIFGADVPSISELKNNVDMLFLNTYPIWDSNRPVPPSVLYMGGLHQNPKKELSKGQERMKSFPSPLYMLKSTTVRPKILQKCIGRYSLIMRLSLQDLKNYLDNSKNGVIYVSFGTNVSPSLLPSEKIQTLLRVFSKLPYDVLWKWDKDVLPGQSSNIRIGKWFPQSDLLKHPNIKLFVTQGGFQSTDEALAAGIPLLGMPMLGDQWYNVEMYVKHKIGKRVDLETVTDKLMEDAIFGIINDNSYRTNIVKLRSLMLDTPVPPLERAIWWIEHVLRHGGAKHLRSPAANISWSEFIELPLLLTLLAIATTAVSVLTYIVFFAWSYIISKKIWIKSKIKQN